MKILQQIDIGRQVICDSCSKDYTDLPDKGGILFGSKAICPECTPTWKSRASHFGEESFIKGECLPTQSFADWVRELRGGNNTLTVYSA